MMSASDGESFVRGGRIGSVVCRCRRTDGWLAREMLR